MSLKHNNKRNKKTASIEIGDFVTLMIPREDRGHSYLNRIPGQVFAKNGGDGKHETYSIVTAYRKLSEKYPVKCLSIYEGNVKINNEITLSLHAAAALASRHTVDSAVVKSKFEC